MVALCVVSGCTGNDDAEGPVTVQPGAPGEPGQVLEGQAPVPDHPYSPADVRFLQAMIPHHAQALRMTGLVADRTEREDLALFAQRIEITQAGEITQMEDWLEARGEQADAAAGHDHHHDDEPMPGMLTEEQFAALAAATGTEFDRRFLELMIHHHEGALIMVDELRASGGGQPAEISQLATHIDVEQRIEIDRMEDLLADLGTG